MCAPAAVVAGWAAFAAAAAGTAVQIHGQRQAAKYQTAVAEQNARLAEKGAADALRRGGVEQEKARLRAARFLATQRTRIAASGAALGEGSAGGVLEDTAAASQHEVNVIRNNAVREAFGLKSQSAAFQSSAAFAQSSAKTNITGTLLGGSSQMFAIYSKTGLGTTTKKKVPTTTKSTGIPSMAF